MFRVILQKFVLFLVYQLFVESTADVLNLFRPQPDLPQQLNDFLIDVQQHKKDFAFIRNVAKNRRKYEQSYAENHHLFAEDLDNQLTLAPYYSKRFDNFENRISRPNVYDQIGRSPEFSQENSFRSYYPNERYSKFIHSPVRLQRELEANYLDSHVKLDPNGMYGQIKRPEPKFPANRFENNENKYRGKYLVGSEADDNGDDYSELKPTNKKKREVEISIKSDGKLVKRIEEDENGPKSIILNIKASNSNDKSQKLDNSASQAVQLSGASTAVALSTIQLSQNNKNLDSGPSNSKTIPSLTKTNPNQNSAQSKNIGVPINSIPASNSALSNNKNEIPSLKQKDDSNNDLNAKNVKESVNKDKSSINQEYSLPEVSKVLNSEDFRPRINTYKSLGENFENSRWSGDSNQMAKSIDIAQNNVNKFSSIKDRLNIDADLEEPKKESDFEKVQGLVVDSTNANENGINENKIKYTNKRQSIKEKRWDETVKGMDGSNLPLDIQDIQSQAVANRAFDYSVPLEKEAIDLSNIDTGQAMPESMHWKTDDHEIHLNPNEKYEIIEHSTKDILIIPIVETTACPSDLHFSNEDLNDEAKVEEAKIIGEAIVQEIKKEDEKAEAEREYEETTECTSEKHFPNHQEEKESEEEKEKEEEREAEIEIIRHEEEKEHQHCHHDSNKESNERTKQMGVLHHDPKHHHENHIINHKSQKKKRQIVKKKKPNKYVIKQKRHDEDSNKLEQEKKSYWDSEALRNKKHMAPVPKYKKKRIRQHPKKRVDRMEEEPSFVDYYNFNELYGPPDDTFDFIPSFHKRQLQSVSYEYDPNLIHDIGDHDEEEIKKFEKAQDEKERLKKLKSKEQEEDDKKFQGHRKKFKSEGDYSDEEESNRSATRKIPIKKTKNQFASNTQATTEDNDDDYNYQDLSDMEDEEEDVAYEEEKSDDINVDEAVRSNNQSEDESDRFNLDKLMAAYLATPQFILEPTTKRHIAISMVIKELSAINDKKFMGNVRENDNVHENNNEKENENEKSSVSRGHGSASKKQKKKRQKKKPKRNDENNKIEKTHTDLAEDVSSFHGRGNSGYKLVKHKQVKPKREDIEPINQKGNDLTKSKLSDQFEKKPLSNQEKQNIILRYNPDFQRWPRFVQSDNVYRELMRKRALEHQKRSFRNANNMNRFPKSDEYFLNHENEFVKREEPSTESSTVAASSAASEAASETTSKATTEAASNAASEATNEAASEPVSEAASSGAEGAIQSSTAETFAEQKEQASETTPNMETEPTHAQENINGATLPQAAKNILQTANSDIFENTTAPLLDGPGNGNNSAEAGAGAGSSQEFNGGATQFLFTTNADDLTENTLCVTPHKDISPCPDENASHSPVTITSVLPLVAESATMLKQNMTKSEYLDLNDIVGGSLPRNIVSNSLSSAKGSIRQGLNTGKYNMNLNLSNYNSNAETKMILNEMTNLMLKLKYHTTCQMLPGNLRTYIKSITKNEMDNPMLKIKEMEEIDFDEHQSSYVFHGSEGDSIQNKAQALKDLLNKYNDLPDNCKERAEPVREYIESHLAMIDNVSGNRINSKSHAEAMPAGNSTTVHPKAKKEINLSNSGNSEEKDLNGQMMEEGLNNQHPNANEAIEEKEKKSKREAMNFRFPPAFRKELSTSTSPQYGKLEEAVRKLRHRRESAKRIGEIYGRATRDQDKVENDEQSKKDKGFESPLVINF